MSSNRLGGRAEQTAGMREGGRERFARKITLPSWKGKEGHISGRRQRCEGQQPRELGGIMVEQEKGGQLSK